MTTDRKDARITLTTSEWRLLLTAALAATYGLAWIAFAVQGPPRDRSAATEEPRARESVVWLDELPPARRPAVTIPAGWTLAVRGAVPAVSRVPGARPPRVRTRSS